MIASFGGWGGWAALTALGTVGAVVVAVGLQWWLTQKEHDRQPTLTLSFDSHKLTNETSLAGTTLPYLRLAVANAEGKDTARDVEVLVISIDEYAVRAAGSGGRNVWLANPALAWANSVDPVPRMSIPPGATRYVDVGRWVQAPMVAQQELRLSIVPDLKHSDRHQLPPGDWRLRLAVTVRNADATFWDVEVSWGSTATAGIAQMTNLTADVRSAA